MRHALPLIWCVSPDTRAKLLGMVTDLDSVPADVMVEWNPEQQPRREPLDEKIDYDKFIRQTPYPGRPKP